MTPADQPARRGDPGTEVVLVGPHPDYIGVDVVVLGTDGSDLGWQWGCELAGTALSAAAARGIQDSGCVVVDIGRDVVRPTKGIRRIR